MFISIQACMLCQKFAKEKMQFFKVSETGLTWQTGGVSKEKRAGGGEADWNFQEEGGYYKTQLLLWFLCLRHRKHEWHISWFLNLFQDSCDFLSYDLISVKLQNRSIQTWWAFSGSGDLVDVKCGDDGCSTTGVENRACVPIPVAVNDVDFRNKSCLMFVRTQEVLQDDCRLG